METFDLNNFISENDFNLFKKIFSEELKKARETLKQNGQKDPNIFNEIYNKLFNEHKFPEEIYSQLKRKLGQELSKDKIKKTKEDLIKGLKKISIAKEITKKLSLSKQSERKNIYKKYFKERNLDESKFGGTIIDCSNYATDMLCKELRIEPNEELYSLFLDRLYREKPFENKKQK